MRAISTSQALLAGGCALLLSACGIVQPGPLPDQVLPQWPGAPPPVPAPTPTAPVAPVKPAPKPKPTTAPTTTAPETSTTAPDAGSSFDNLELVDESLNGKLAILRVGSQPTDTNLLGVFAGLKNKTARRLNLEVQTIYKDKSDTPLNKGSWISLTLQPHEETEYHSASISDQAVDFLIRIRRAAPVKAPPPPPQPPDATQ